MNAYFVSFISLFMIFAATSLGSAMVFFFKKNFSKTTGQIIIGLASGIMIATSFFGLLLPSIEEAKTLYGEKLSFLPVSIGFILGGLVLYVLDKLVPHIHNNMESEEEGIKTSKITKRTKFILAVTLHNIPEGIAVGLLCGLCFGVTENVESTYWSALSLAIGIAIQNFPEGSAVSIPLLEDNISKPKAFLYGVLTGVVEPIFGFIALFLATIFTEALPYLLSFAAGAMIYVTIDELIPEFKEGGNGHIGLWSFMFGFLLMMILEIVL